MSALCERVADTVLDLVFVNAAMTNGDVPSTEVSTEAFTEMMVTNALDPLHLVGALRDVVTPNGTIGVMSSRQGSLTLNDPTVADFGGGHDAYRASKSALNQLVRSFAARHVDDPRILLLINPGQARTGLGGPSAPLTRASPGSSTRSRSTPVRAACTSSTTRTRPFPGSEEQR